MNKRITSFIGSLVLASSSLSFGLISEVNAGTWRCCKNVQSCRPNQVREKERAKGFKVFGCKDACRCREKTAAELAADKKAAAEKAKEDRRKSNERSEMDRDRGKDRDNKRR